ncbi:MAG: hypothetical protein AAGG38_12815 [Planctomycetota bacterium]
MTFVRTVLGDLPSGPDDPGLGCGNAHEHLALDGPFVADRFTDFLLDDPEVVAQDLRAFKQHGGGWAIDTMPTGPGRNPRNLMEVSRRSGVAVVAATGLHLAMYYPDRHPMLAMGRRELSALFVREIVSGVDEPGTEFASSLKAGVIKVAGGRGRLDALQREAFAAAGRASAETGCPIITHCEAGTAGPEQIDRLLEAGADPRHVVLSHCDRIPDRNYHADLLRTGVTLEYDNHFRTLQRNGTCPTAELVADLIREFPDQIVAGMDLARRSYWPGFGGGPGPVWLVTAWPDLLRQHGVADHAIERILTHNPRRCFSFA